MRHFYLSILSLLFFLSCNRNDEILFENFNEIIIDSSIPNIPEFKNPTLSINEGKLIFNEELNNEKIEIGISNHKWDSGNFVPNFIVISFIDSSNIADKFSNLNLEIKKLEGVGKTANGILSGDLEINGKSENLRFEFNIELSDILFFIEGEIWYDAIKNNIKDYNENGVNGLRIQNEINGVLFWEDVTFKKPNYLPITEGHFKLKVSTANSNFIRIKNIPPSLKMVIPNFGIENEISSNFEEDGTINNFTISDTTPLYLFGGVTPK